MMVFLSVLSAMHHEASSPGPSRAWGGGFLSVLWGVPFWRSVALCYMQYAIFGECCVFYKRQATSMRHMGVAKHLVPRQ